MKKIVKVQTEKNSICKKLDKEKFICNLIIMSF